MKVLFNGWALGGTLVIAGLIASASIGTHAVAQAPGFNDLYDSCMTNMKKDCHDWALKGGGGDGPRGLTRATKVELAPGEKYILTGIVDILDGSPYFAINLRKHAWLASTSRLSDPYYRIEGPTSAWKKYRGREISLVATARYTAWETRSGKLRIEVYLDPAEDPVPPSLQRR